MPLDLTVPLCPLQKLPSFRLVCSEEFQISGCPYSRLNKLWEGFVCVFVCFETGYNGQVKFSMVFCGAIKVVVKDTGSPWSGHVSEGLVWAVRHKAWMVYGTLAWVGGGGGGVCFNLHRLLPLDLDH